MTLDHKGDPDKYPPPEERHCKADFPAEDELYTYGVDFPIPEAFSDLRCTYNEKEPTPPLQLEELRGYKVPPLGIDTVWVNGVGAKLGAAGMMYKPGTFREDRHTAGKEFGKMGIELATIREDNKAKAIINGITEALDKHEIEIKGDTTADVLQALTFVTLDRLLDPNTPAKELRIATFENILKELTRKEEIVERNRERVAEAMGMKSMEQLDQALDAINKLIDERKGEVIDTVPYDVSGEDE